MSKGWKIAIGVIIAVVVVAAISLPLVGRLLVARGWWGGLDWGHDADEVVVRYREAPQLEMRLVDDDADGVPDRGVVDLPAVGAWRDLAGPRSGWGRVTGYGRPFGLARGPFAILGRLPGLLLLVLLIVLGVRYFRRRSRPPAAPQQGVSG